MQFKNSKDNEEIEECAGEDGDSGKPVDESQKQRVEGSEIALDSSGKQRRAPASGFGGLLGGEIVKERDEDSKVQSPVAQSHANLKESRTVQFQV